MYATKYSIFMLTNSIFCIYNSIAYQLNFCDIFGVSDTETSIHCLNIVISEGESDLSAWPEYGIMYRAGVSVE